jgi:5'-nucleotidase
MDLMKNKRPQILLTNDDGIHSPGLWAAAEALASLGFVTIAAPSEQYSSAGRSQPLTSDGRIGATNLRIGTQDWEAFAVNGSPAQCVLYAVLELMRDNPPDLVVSGINYGENVGLSVTASGTVGAAMEAAVLGIPALAVSRQIENIDEYTDNSADVDFTAAMAFTQKFARRLLEGGLPSGVDLLKLDVPKDATPETPWRVTRLGHHGYFIPYDVDRKGGLDQPALIRWRIQVNPGDVPPDTDVHAIQFDRVVSVTPMTLDMTPRVPLEKLDRLLRTEPQRE